VKEFQRQGEQFFKSEQTWEYSQKEMRGYKSQTMTLLSCLFTTAIIFIQ
jgi:hypothetical protein